VLEEGVEVITGNLHASLKIGVALQVNNVLYFLELINAASRSSVLFQSVNEGIGALNKVNSILDTADEQAVEGLTAPLNAMLDQVGEVTQSAHGDTFLWRVLRVTVAKGLVGDNHLRVGLGAEGAGLEERLLVPDALLIDVESGLDVIDSVNDEVEALPELIVEGGFGRHVNIGVVGSDVELGVHLFGDHAGGG